MGIEQILSDYRNGNEDKRLGLFMTYRDLRNEFSRIDEDVPVVQSPVLRHPTSFRGNPAKSRCPFFLHRIHGTS